MIQFIFLGIPAPSIAQATLLPSGLFRGPLRFRASLHFA
jgi:hypothetical protein